MNESRIDNLLKETLQETAKPLKAPDDLKAKIRFAANANPSAKPKPFFGKKLAAAVIVAAVAVTGAVAGSGVVSITSHTYHDKAWKAFNETEAYAEMYVPDAKYVESFENGYKFASGNTSTASKDDATGNSLGTFTDLYLIYEKDGSDIYFEAGPVQDEITYDSIFDTVKNIEGVDVHYRNLLSIYLPPDGSEMPTEEEQKRFENGEINIAYGTETREEKTYHTVRWIENDIAYDISCFDTADLTEDDFFNMAAEVIGAEN